MTLKFSDIVNSSAGGNWRSRYDVRLPRVMLHFSHFCYSETF